MLCSSNALFVVDGSCLVKGSYDSFLGSPIFDIDSGTQTFTYGVTRDFLRLRQSLGATSLALIFGKETYAAINNPQMVNDAATFLYSMGVSVINAAAYSVVDISLTFIETAKYFVSSNPNLLQLTQHGPEVVFVGVRQNFTIHSAATVRAQFGVDPIRIPDLLVLTQGPHDLRITNAQAVRLLELYAGGLEEFLRSPCTVKNRLALGRLKGNEARLREQFVRLLPSGSRPVISTNSVFACNLNTPQNREFLCSRKFHSLVRMLPTPEPICVLSADKGHRNVYTAVVDGAGLAALVSAVRSGTICAIDTESTGKDPHHADLLGVSFCLKEGEAFYVPVNADDLRGISPAQVLFALQEIGQCGTAFVGQNLKYDYVLLRRHGVVLSNCAFDTMLAAHECYRDLEFFNLNQLAQKLLKRTIKEYKEIVKDGQTLLDVPFTRLVDYACEDAETTFRLYKVLQDELQFHFVLGQFQLETMPLALALGRLEYEGVNVDVEKLQKLRQEARARITRYKNTIHSNTGKCFDVDSEHEVRIALSGDKGIGEFFRGERPTLAILEALSGNSDIARYFVQYRREKDVLRRIEDVLEHCQDGKVYPVFNQISSRYGQVSSRSPDLFATNLLQQVVSASVATLYPDNLRSVKSVASLSNDPVLLEDIENGVSSN